MIFISLSPVVCFCLSSGTDKCKVAPFIQCNNTLGVKNVHDITTCSYNLRQQIFIIFRMHMPTQYSIMGYGIVYHLAQLLCLAYLVS